MCSTLRWIGLEWKVLSRQSRLFLPLSAELISNIKSPECFEIEKRLKEELDIPVMHDDQHGTAIISGAALINGLEVVDKKIGDVTVVGFLVQGLQPYLVRGITSGLVLIEVEYSCVTPRVS